MPLTNAGVVKEAGQLEHTLFPGLASEGELTALIDRQLAIADAFIYRRVGESVYNDTTPQIVTMLAAAECYLALSYITAMLKARKVYGSHAPIDTEDSSSFHDVLEPEWRQMAIELLDEFAVIDEAGHPFALPSFLVSTDVDETLTQQTPEDIREQLDRARGYSIPEVPAIR